MLDYSEMLPLRSWPIGNIGCGSAPMNGLLQLGY